MNNLDIDSREVINLFADLTGRQQRQVYRNALRRAAGILSKEAKKQLKQAIGRAVNHRNWWNGKTLNSGIKVNADRQGTEAKVHIMGDFRLKFFENGTANRYTTGSNSASVRGRTPLRRQSQAANRGRITASYFFKTAKENKEQEVFGTLNNLISQSIQKVAHRNRQ